MLSGGAQCDFEPLADRVRQSLEHVDRRHTPAALDTGDRGLGSFQFGLGQSGRCAGLVAQFCQAQCQSGTLIGCVVVGAFLSGHLRSPLVQDLLVVHSFHRSPSLLWRLIPYWGTAPTRCASRPSSPAVRFR